MHSTGASGLLIFHNRSNATTSKGSGVRFVQAYHVGRMLSHGTHGMECSVRHCMVFLQAPCLVFVFWGVLLGLAIRFVMV